MYDTVKGKCPTCISNVKVDLWRLSCDHFVCIKCLNKMLKIKAGVDKKDESDYQYQVDLLMNHKIKKAYPEKGKINNNFLIKDKIYLIIEIGNRFIEIDEHDNQKKESR